MLASEIGRLGDQIMALAIARVGGDEARDPGTP